MLPDKVRFRFVFATCVFGYLRDINHFVTHEVTTAKSVQTSLLSKTTKFVLIWSLDRTT